MCQKPHCVYMWSVMNDLRREIWKVKGRELLHNSRSISTIIQTFAIKIKLFVTKVSDNLNSHYFYKNNNIRCIF